MNYIKEIRTENIIFGIRNDGIMESRVLEKHNFTTDLENAIEMEEAMKTLSGNQHTPLMIVMSDNRMTNEGRHHLMNNIHVSAAAMVSNTFVSNMMATILLKFNPTLIPIKIFSSEEKALDWLRGVEKKVGSLVGS